MSTWPTAWREHTLTHINVPITQHALDVLRDWHASTPTQPWTNNPLGLPALGNNVPEALGTPYGAFPDHKSFRVALERVADGSGPLPLRIALCEGTPLGRVWRTVNGLHLPGVSTESDYPAVLLDRVEHAYRSKIQTVKVQDRKSMGSGPLPVDMHHPVLKAASDIHHAALNIQDLNQAIRYLTQRIQ